MDGKTINSNSQKIVVIDICGTLFRCDTTFTFIEYLYLHSKKVRIIKLVFKSYIGRLLNGILFRFFKYDFRRKYMIGLLRNMKKEDLYEKAETFYKSYLKQKINYNVIDFIRNIQGFTILTSATIDPVAHAINSHLRFNMLLSSKLQYSEEEICEGVLKEDLLGRKIEVIRSYGVINPIDYVISNDFSDMPLFLESQNQVIISKLKHLKKWQRITKTHHLDNNMILCID